MAANGVVMRIVPRREPNKVKRQICADILVGILLMFRLLQEFRKGVHQSEEIVNRQGCEVEGDPEISSHGLGHSDSDAESKENTVFTSDLESLPGVSQDMNGFMNSLQRLPVFFEKHEKMKIVSIDKL